MPFSRMPFRRLVPLAFVALVACSPIIDTRGNLPEPEDLEKITVGATSREEVARILGTPTSVATFDPNTWYYISKRTETVAFLRPETVEQQVVTVRFDESGMVKELSDTGKEPPKEIALVGRTTPTAGQTFSLFQQIFGNLGRFGDAPTKKRLPSPTS
jgi:outer membrane protein assembly factor BamE (lipoprotein component of BamABCDE complex)